MEPLIIFAVAGPIVAAWLGRAAGKAVNNYLAHKHNAEVRLEEYRIQKRRADALEKELKEERALRMEPGSGKDTQEAPGYDGPAWGTPPKARGPVVRDDDDDDYVDIVTIGGPTRRMNIGTGRMTIDHGEPRIDRNAWQEELERVRDERDRLLKVIENDKRQMRAMMAGPQPVTELRKMGYIEGDWRFTDQYERTNPDGSAIYRNTMSQTGGRVSVSSMSIQNEQHEAFRAAHRWCQRMNRTLEEAPKREVYNTWTFRTRD